MININEEVKEEVCYICGKGQEEAPLILIKGENDAAYAHIECQQDFQSKHEKD